MIRVGDKHWLQMALYGSRKSIDTPDLLLAARGCRTVLMCTAPQASHAWTQASGRPLMHKGHCSILTELTPLFFRWYGVVASSKYA